MSSLVTCLLLLAARCKHLPTFRNVDSTSTLLLLFIIQLPRVLTFWEIFRLSLKWTTQH